MSTPFTDLADLASSRLGGRVLWANDEFFAPKNNLLKPEKPQWKEGLYTNRGKWMDGWETRRRRTPGHDSCIIKLGVTGKIHGIVVDTSYFTGNYPEQCSLEALNAPGASQAALLKAAWQEILPTSALKGNFQNLFEIQSRQAWTHLRLHIYPDGGVARLRVHGEPDCDWKRRSPGPEVRDLPSAGGAKGASKNLIDLASITNGGLVLGASNMHFGSKDNLIMPERAKNMGDGWETRRRRGPGYDWCLLRLGTTGLIERIEVDTNHFKGNYPDRCTIEGIQRPDALLNDLIKSPSWHTIIKETKLNAHQRRFFSKEIEHRGPFSHLRLNIFPDGGVSRLRVWGRPVLTGLERLNSLPASEALRELLKCCASRKWARAAAQRRPFQNAESLLAHADQIWVSLSPQDWLEAFVAHPKIGDQKTPNGSWAKAEQSGVQGAAPAILKALAEGNRAYQEKFGYIFIVCATGKSAQEMLDLLSARLPNLPDQELAIAAREQAKITKIRLEKLLST